MIALKMEDLKASTAHLFVRETFDGWLLREASVVTFNSFTIDGHIRQGYYTQEELEEDKIEDLSSWKVIRPICFSLIKGKKLPRSFKITLQLSAKKTEEFLQTAGAGIPVSQVGGFYLYFRYEDQVLRCMTGVSLKTFIPDRQIEQEWDEQVKQILKEKRIPFTEE